MEVAETGAAVVEAPLAHGKPALADVFPESQIKTFALFLEEWL